MAFNFVESSKRTSMDAESLWAGGRIGTADHLFGLAAECALKAILIGLKIIPPEGPPKRSPYRVHIDELWDQYAIYVSAPGLPQLALPRFNEFKNWRADHRYEEESTFTIPRVDTHRAGMLQILRMFEAARVAGVI